MHYVNSKSVCVLNFLMLRMDRFQMIHERVDSYTYMETIIESNGKLDKEINQMLRKQVYIEHDEKQISRKRGYTKKVKGGSC